VLAALDTLERELADSPYTAPTADRLAELGTSRRVALPLLDRLDRLGLTRRLPDDRRVTTNTGSPRGRSPSAEESLPSRRGVTSFPVRGH
jgi:Elongation factor SelB, winged helix